MDIIDAIKNCDYDNFNAALIRCSVNDMDLKGWTALHWAAEYENFTFIKALIRANCNIDICNAEGATALSLACYKNGYLTISMVEAFLQACPECVAISNYRGLTPLMIASSYSSTEVVKSLLKYGSDVNMKDNKGKTALWHAKSCLRMDIEYILLEASADESIAQLSILEAAIFNNLNALQDALQLQCEYSEWESDEFGNTALHHLAQGESVIFVKALIEARCPITAKNKYGETALFAACCAGSSVEVVQALIDANKNLVNMCNEEGVYPIMEASARSQTVVVTALVAAGADVNVIKDGYSPLWDAQEEERFDIYNVLLKAGANPMQGCDFGFYMNYLFRRWMAIPGDVIELLNVDRSRKLCGDVIIQADRFGSTHYEIKNEFLYIIKEFVKALTESGANVQYLDVNDSQTGYPNALTIRFETKVKLLKMWLATQSSAIEPNIIDRNNMCLKHLARRKIRNILGHNLRSEKCFYLALEEMGLPKDLQMYLRYL